MILAQVIIAISILGLVHSYLIYPSIVYLLSRGKKANHLFYKNENLPRVSVLMSLYNEEKVIREKLASLQKLTYPKDRIQFYIGSDCSDDQTNTIVENYAATQGNCNFFPLIPWRVEINIGHQYSNPIVHHGQAE